MSYIGTIRNTERTQIMYQNILCCHPLKQIAYPQSPSLCEPATVSDAKVVGGGGTDVTCCQVGTRICCARLDQACVSAEKKSSYTSSNFPLDAVSLHIHAFFSELNCHQSYAYYPVTCVMTPGLICMGWMGGA